MQSTVSADYRSLVKLSTLTPTARVLNLRALEQGRSRPPPPVLRLFLSARLERSLIVKHRLRSNEAARMLGPARTVTKVLIPLDPHDLDAGAVGVIVGEAHWREQLDEHAALDSLPDRGEQDLLTLCGLDHLPSLDPFLAREHLRSLGREIDESYFALNEADMARMLSFVNAQMRPLVDRCLGRESSAAQVDRLSRKLLRTQLDASMEPLRATLRLRPDQFGEGMFCWKGFLYYKWVVADELAGVRELAASVGRQRFGGRASLEERAYLSGAQPRLAQAVLRAAGSARGAIATYDNAFSRMTTASDSTAFREFLLDAPRLFRTLGEKLGAVQHVASFWKYRVGQLQGSLPCAADLVELLRDFELSLVDPTEAEAARAA